MTSRARPPRTHAPTTRFVLRAAAAPFSLLCELPTSTAPARRRLAELAALPELAEALFLASSELSQQLEAGQGTAATAGSPTTRHTPGRATGLATGRATGRATEFALLRYLARMAGRATPFGLFAGVAVATAGPATRLALGPSHAHRRHTRLDNDYLARLCEALARAPGLRDELTLRANSSLYRVGPRWRYAEDRLDDTGRAYRLVSVEATPYIDEVLARAQAGATRAALAEMLAADPELSAEDIDAFLSELVDTQLLVSELRPPVTGREPGAVIAERLAASPSGAPAGDLLRRTLEALEALDASAGTPPSRYRELAATLAELPAEVHLARLFQVDLHLTMETATVGPSVLREIERGVALTRRLTPSTVDPRWQSFREAFERRYESREVPLSEVLDEEAGIGFDEHGDDAAQAPLLADLVFPGPSAPAQVPWSRYEAHLLRLLTETVASGASELELTAQDLDELSGEPAELTDTFCADVTLVATSAEALAADEFLVRFDGVSRGSATRLLGRFCHGSPELTALTQELADREAALAGDALLAEIVHLPEGRVGNILLRPLLRRHEIPYLGRSGAAPEDQIPITDLLVSVRHGKVVLRSATRGVEVRPQLATAHNTSVRSLVVYRFLSALALQDQRSHGFTWSALAGAPFLPRVRHGRLVLARARWNLIRADLAPLARGEPDGPDALAALAALRTRRKLPRWIVVSDLDNELPVDLDHPLAAAMFVQLVRQRQSVLLQELFPGPDALCATGPEGAHVHELLVPFVRCAPPPAATLLARPGTKARRFPPGSEWLYLKLYGGAVNAEIVLRDTVAPLVDEALAEGLATSFFFLRYADPDRHLRLRFRGDPARLTAELLPRLTERLTPALQDGLLWRLTLDTYEREIERYGGDLAIELAERWFAADSAAALQIAAAYGGDEGAQARWLLALRGCDQLLGDLELTTPERLAVVTAARDQLRKESGMDVALQRKLGERYRAHQAEILAILQAPADIDDQPLALGLRALAARSAQCRPLAAELGALARRGELSVSLPTLAASLMHMHVNRVLATAQRLQEGVLYDLLHRVYEGVLARSRRADT